MEQQSGTCPVCDDSASIDSSNKDTLKVECRMCGKFEITIEALKLFNESSTHSKIILFQEWVSSNQGKIVDERLVEILVAPYPLPSILLYLMIYACGSEVNWKELNSSIDISSLELLGIIKVHSEEELLYVLQQFSQMGYIGYTYEDRIRGIESITLSMKF
ncbi:MAG: hypothetical protein H6613_12895 [Ignavibacteriales bacterium]|nr:hypothetical protein [Ignavibacteriales bacterium]